jgi:hypothetical protein
MIWKLDRLWGTAALATHLENQRFLTRLDLDQVPVVLSLSMGNHRCLEKRDCSEQRLAFLHFAASCFVAWPVGFLAFTATVGGIELFSIVVARSTFASGASQGCIQAAVGAAHHDEYRDICEQEWV